MHSPQLSARVRTWRLEMISHREAVFLLPSCIWRPRLHDSQRDATRSRPSVHPNHHARRSYTVNHVCRFHQGESAELFQESARDWLLAGSKNHTRWSWMREGQSQKADTSMELIVRVSLSRAMQVLRSDGVTPATRYTMEKLRTLIQISQCQPLPPQAPITDWQHAATPDAQMKVNDIKKTVRTLLEQRIVNIAGWYGAHIKALLSNRSAYQYLTDFIEALRMGTHSKHSYHWMTMAKPAPLAIGEKGKLRPNVVECNSRNSSWQLWAGNRRTNFRNTWVTNNAVEVCAAQGDILN